MMLRITILGLGIAVGAVALLLGVFALRGGAPAEADVPHEGLDFAIGIDVDGDGDNDCGTGVPSAVGDGAPDAVPVEVTNTTCTAEADADLDVRVYLMDNGGIVYTSVAAWIDYIGLTPSWPGISVWTCHTFDSAYGGTNYEVAGSTIGITPPCNVGRTDRGLTNVFSFTCTEGGFVSLAHGYTSLFDSDLQEHREVGPDKLAVTCGNRAPVPGTPPMWPPTPTPTPHGPPSFALGIDVDGDGDNDCGTGVLSAVGDGAPDPVPTEVTNTTCTAAADAKLDVRVYLMDNGGIAYAGQSARISYHGLTSQRHGATHWLCGFFSATDSGPNWESVGAALGLPGESQDVCVIGRPQTNLGLMNSFEFACSQGGVIALEHNETGLTDKVLREYREAGPDDLNVVCGDRTPAPSPTPTATRTPTNTPTPRPPTPTPTPCLSCTSAQFAVGIDLDGNGTNDCGTGVPRNVGDGAPDAVPVEVGSTSCSAAHGSLLTVNAYLLDNSGVEYGAVGVTLAYEGVSSKGPGESVWDGCVFSAVASFGTFENAGCTIGVEPAMVPVDHVGFVARFAFTCDQDGTLELTHGKADTAITDLQFDEYWEQGGEDRLDVLCEEATAGDADCGGGVDSIDAALILQYGAGLLDALACKDAADVDEDGAVDARDAALVLQYAAGLIPGLG